jgi:hypothetical protein
MERAQVDLGAQERRQIAERVAAIDETAGILARAPDWPLWLDQVRGNSAGDVEVSE